MNFNSDERTIVVVGGTSGLGLATARYFGERSFQIIVGGRDQGKVDAARSALGNACVARTVDIVDEESVRKFFAEIPALDHLVVTASASFSDKPLRDTAVADLQRFAEVKLWGALRCAKAAHERIRTGGSITFVSGAVSQKGRHGAHAKTITNSALEAVARSLAVEYGPRVRVNAVSPAMFDSKGTMPEARRTELEQMYPAHYVGTAADVAAVIHCVAVNPFISGTTVFVDGGWTAA